MANESALDKAVTEAADKLIPGEEKTEAVETEKGVEVEIPAPAAATTETEDESEGDSTDEPQGEAETDLDEAQATEAKNLYKALNNPKTTGAVLAALAQHLGFQITPQSTKAEVKEAKSSILDTVAEALGEEYKFLAPKLGSAIDKALATERERYDAKFAEIQQQQVLRETTSVLDKLARETKGESKKLEARMAELAKEIPVGEMKVETYARRLYTLAQSEVTQKSAKQNADKIRKNATDAPGRLKTATAVAPPAGNVPDKKMGLKESVDFALGQLTSQRK